ncbi:unnamed protein product [Chironomus riparius]|uniref:Uncharacterized protein n=1 Tax=Chironomus riparius TaxID=315576 RepID=A0A9N9S994_9DIPT|nr:unnamed protein product [Chironomus riparius]
MHSNGLTINDVNCFYSIEKNFQFFPKDLDKIFNNLEGIVIANAHIKEVHQNDLKPFTKLVHLGLHVNEIEIIDEDLFKFNPNLKMISLRDNKIKQIHSKVFDNLPHLVKLRLLGNQCIDKDSELSSKSAGDIIKLVKLQCTISEQLNIEKQIKNLENDVNHIKFEDYEANSTKIEENFTKIEAQIKDLGLPKSHDLSVMLENVKNVKIPFVVSLFKEIQNSSQKSSDDIHNYHASIVNLDHQVSAFQEDLESIKSEVYSNFQEILDNLDQMSDKIGQKVDEKFNEITKSMQTAQGQLFSMLNDKIKSIENGLNDFSLKCQENNNFKRGHS